MAKKLKTLVGKKLIFIFVAVSLAMMLTFYFSTFFAVDKNTASLNNLYINMFNHINDGVKGSLHEAVEWDDMVDFISNPNAEWVEVNLSSLFSEDGKNRVVVLNGNNEIIYPQNMELPEELISGIAFNTRGGNAINFYTELKGEYYFVAAEGVKTSEGEPKEGVTFALRKIDREYVNQIGEIFDSEIEFIQPSDRKKAKADKLTRSIIPLEDIHKNAIVYLQVKQAGLFTALIQKGEILSIFSAILFIAMIVLVILLLKKYVQKPVETLANNAESKKDIQFDNPEDTAQEFNKICGALNSANEEAKKLTTAKNEISDLENRLKGSIEDVNNLSNDLNKEKEYQKILSDEICDGIVSVTSDLDITECNRAAQEIFAFDKNDDPSQYSIYNFVSSNGTDVLTSLISNPPEEYEFFQTEGQDKNDEQKLFNIKIQPHPTKNGEFLLIICDETSTLNHEKQIENLKFQFENDKQNYRSTLVNNIINSLPQSIYYKNKNLEYQYVNAAFAQQNGLDINQILGKTDSQLNIDNQADESILASDENSERTTVGEQALSIVKTVCKDDNGQIAGLLSVTDDITLPQKLEFATRAVSQNESYAKTVQSNIMPNIDTLKNLFGDVFIIYRPINEVGGDFYYLNQKDKKTILAVGDCTGHGVAGAFMTTLAIVTLNKVINQAADITPTEILNNLETEISKIIDKEADLKDGLDICLAIFDKKLKTIEYSGAHSPLYIVRDENIVELEAAKCPIGEYSKTPNFTTEKFTIRKGDNVYMCTDGFQNQFGGEKNRKFNKNALKQLLIQNANSTAQEQQTALETAFNEWAAQQNAPQVDDVTILGIKF